MDFLNENGLLVFERLKKHCRDKLKTVDIDELELAMLANSFSLYAESAKYCKDNGVKFTIITEKGASYDQICPEYTVMKSEYANILKHGAKFGLNPGDRLKIFKDIDTPKKKGFDLGNGENMKKAV